MPNSQENTQSDAVKTVRAFLLAVENRDLVSAQSLVSEDFTMVFPGDRRMASLSDFSNWAGTRYRFVRKSYDRFDVADDVVYSVGMLSGEWLSGNPFSGIRFIDRFELKDGLIVLQQVWNDLGETKST